MTRVRIHLAGVLAFLAASISLCGALPLSAQTDSVRRVVRPRSTYDDLQLFSQLGLERRRLDGSLVRLTRPVRRERAEEASAVPIAMMLDAVTGYARITTFANTTVAEDLNVALRRLESSGMTRLVLDLRDNAFRVVYGGGGVLLPEGGGNPVWAARLVEEAIPLAWVGGWVSANATSLITLEQFVEKPALPPEALSDFRVFAARMGVTVPAGDDSDARLQRLLVTSVAAAKWGQTGWYRPATRMDPEISSAVQAFARAAELR